MGAQQSAKGVKERAVVLKMVFVDGRELGR
jgi:hypothetical protein